MSLQEKSDLVLTFAQLLHENGQSTDDTLAAAERLSNSLGLPTTIIPGWEEIQLETTDGTGKSVSLATAPPAGADMERVVSTMRALRSARDGLRRLPRCRRSLRLHMGHRRSSALSPKKNLIAFVDPASMVHPYVAKASGLLQS